MTAPAMPRLSRRTTLAWLAAAAALSGIPSRAFTAVAVGYGTDPDLHKEGPGPWPRSLEPRQLSTVKRLADLLLPAQGDDPAPSAIGIQDFIDEWVSAPYPKQAKDRTTILDGLAALEAAAQAKFKKGFLEIDEAQAGELLDAAAAEPEPLFFRRLRYLVVGGYYTTEVGFKAIGYVGNVPLDAYPAITDETKAILEAELQRLGL